MGSGFNLQKDNTIKVSLFENKYILCNNNISYNLTLCTKNDQLIIDTENYDIKLSIEDLNQLTNFKFESIIKSFEYLNNCFKQNLIQIKEIENKQFIALEIKSSDKKNIFEFYLIYKYSNKYLLLNELFRQNKIATNNLNKLNEEFLSFKKEIDLDNSIKYTNNPKNIELLNDLIINSYSHKYLVNSFVVFQSNNNILYLVYSTKNKSIISYDLNEQQVITQINNPHNNKYITNFRHIFSEKIGSDLLMSISSENNQIKIWDINNWNCILNLENIYLNGKIYSACFLHDDTKNCFIISSNANNKNNMNWRISGPLKVYDLNGNALKEINESDDYTCLVEAFYDKSKDKIYIITGNKNYVKSYEYTQNIPYKKYFEENSGIHLSVNIIENFGVLKLIESCEGDGFIRIWDFHLGELLKKINTGNKCLCDICLWNEKYLIASYKGKSIKIVEMKNGTVNATLNNINIVGIKKIVHKIYGECLLTQGFGDTHIKIWNLKINTK